MASRPRYQIEPVELRDIIWDQGHIAPMQVMRIAAWKSARGLASITLNSEEAIYERTANALKAIRSWREIDVLEHAVDWKRWQDAVADAVGSKAARTGLLGLDGFGYPMATAFLAIAAPTAFPVIDKWTVTAIYGDGTGNYRRSYVYAHFAQALSTHASHHFPEANTIHALDQHVMHAAMRCGHERPCECVPFGPVDFPAEA